MSNIRELPAYELGIFQPHGGVARLADAVATTKEILMKYIPGDPLVDGHQSLASNFGNSALGLLVQGVVMPVQKLYDPSTDPATHDRLRAGADRMMKKIVGDQCNPLDKPSQRTLPVEAYNLKGNEGQASLAVVIAKDGSMTLASDGAEKPRLHAAVREAFGLGEEASLPVRVTREQVAQAGAFLNEARNAPAPEGSRDPATRIVLRPAPHPDETVREAISRICDEIMVRAADIPDIDPRDLSMVVIKANEATRAAREVAAFVDNYRTPLRREFSHKVAGREGFISGRHDDAIKPANDPGHHPRMHMTA